MGSLQHQQVIHVTDAIADGFEHRRRDFATVVFAAWLANDNQHQIPWCFAGKKPQKLAVYAPRR